MRLSDEELAFMRRLLQNEVLDAHLLADMAGQDKNCQKFSDPAAVMSIALGRERMAETILRRLAAPGPVVEGVVGECVEAGHDEEGRPRMLIYCTQEALRDGPALVYRMVRVTPETTLTAALTEREDG